MTRALGDTRRPANALLPGRTMNSGNAQATAAQYPVGLVFDVTFNEFKARIKTLGNNKLQFHIDEGVYMHTEIVNASAKYVRPGLFIVSWTESSCATVVHVQDFDAMKVYSHATLSDGTFLRMEGPMTFVNEENQP